MAEESETQFAVGMTCEGCASAVTRILQRIEGVTSIDTNVPAKLVTVTGSADQALMLEKLMKWSEASGKSVALVSKED